MSKKELEKCPVKVTDQLKHHIIKHVIANKFGALQQVIDTRMQSLSNDIYNALYTVEQQVMMSTAPPGAFALHSERTVVFTSSKQEAVITFKLPIPFFAMHADSIHMDDPFVYDRYLEIWNDSADLNEKMKTTAAITMNTISSVSTVKRLIAKWPSVVEFLPPDANAPELDKDVQEMLAMFESIQTYTTEKLFA